MKRVLAFIVMAVMLVVSCAFVCFDFAELELSGDKKQTEFYLYDGYIVKREHQLNTQMADYAARLFATVYEEQNIDGDVYFALIPDKHRIVNDTADYERFKNYMEQSLEFAQTIEIADLLTLSDYYRSDPHFKQECVVDVALRLCENMGSSIETEFEIKSVEKPFYGVYIEQSGLQVEKDTLRYLVNDSIEDATVEGANKMYDLDKFELDDPYDVFLSGNNPIVKIMNYRAGNDKRLVVFRDSFGSSIAPILSTAYSEVVLVDLRYIMSESLAQYVDFENADVLFLYSTLLLNNSMSMK